MDTDFMRTKRQRLVAELVLSIASVIMLARIFRRMQREDGALGEGAEGGSAFRV